ncbi:carboxypeptidase regulatory-like domain-containing protein [Mycobacterium sp. CBMA271]|uniref:hypothetical protein n=1 Tax=unclassified Mycobacteroides TaxID=2618759 RepID=UPI0012DC30CE|nr:MULTISPECIES: hypothetical protein [unclassified Mycobacteroides]MUM18324.1 hypothetical protein [Mycobacteroides sp. CBMA 326]MUM20018.1 hypothetical protein [Mycobacteroides sp. CBMA 326]MUM20908.1 carboxypeptidase regulatory-like domain-containing protein [Mycobacteroides sp. CBMA 271]
MVGVSFRDSAGRPMAGAVISIASAPSEVHDPAMVADDWGEIVISAPLAGDYRFLVSHVGRTFHATAHITPGQEQLTVTVD